MLGPPGDPAPARGAPCTAPRRHACPLPSAARSHRTQAPTRAADTGLSSPSPHFAVLLLLLLPRQVLTFLLIIPFPRNVRKGILIFTHRTLSFSMSERPPPLPPLQRPPPRLQPRCCSFLEARRGGARGARAAAAAPSRPFLQPPARPAHTRPRGAHTLTPAISLFPTSLSPPLPVGGMKLVHFSMIASGLPLAGAAPRARAHAPVCRSPRPRPPAALLRRGPPGRRARRLPVPRACPRPSGQVDLALCRAPAIHAPRRRPAAAAPSRQTPSAAPTSPMSGTKRSIVRSISHIGWAHSHFGRSDWGRDAFNSLNPCLPSRRRQQLRPTLNTSASRMV